MKYIKALVLEGLLKAHEECGLKIVEEKNYRDGMRDARKLLKQVEETGIEIIESDWFSGTKELFCNHCGKGVHKPRKGDKYRFCPHCGAMMYAEERT